MKRLVIEIPDKVYNYIKDRGYVPPHVNIAPEIANGTVLPEGHGDLIDRDKFKSLMDEYFIDTSRLHYDDLTNAEHINLGIENCFNEIDEMEPVIKADK